jgi:hypothetical protein
LRVVFLSRALLQLDSGGVAAWRREGWVAPFVQSSSRLLGCLPGFGFMPLDGSGAPDLVSQIWGWVGFFLLVLLLQRLERGLKGRADVSLNKAVVLGRHWVWSRGAAMLLLAGLGGGGMKWCGASICASGGWRFQSCGLDAGLLLLAGLGGEGVEEISSVVAGFGSLFSIWQLRVVLLPLAGHGGEGKEGDDAEDGRSGSEVLRGVGGAASSGDPQRRRLCVAVTRGFGSLSALGRRRPSLFSLLACVPFWRVFGCSVAASNVGLSPSGLVPGDGADGCGVELSNGVGGGGLDGFFPDLFEVLFVNCKDLGVFLFFSSVLHVISDPTVEWQL